MSPAGDTSPNARLQFVLFKCFGARGGVEVIASAGQLGASWRRDSRTPPQSPTPPPCLRCTPAGVGGGILGAVGWRPPGAPEATRAVDAVTPAGSACGWACTVPNPNDRARAVVPQKVRPPAYSPRRDQAGQGLTPAGECKRHANVTVGGKAGVGAEAQVENRAHFYTHCRVGAGWGASRK